MTANLALTAAFCVLGLAVPAAAQEIERTYPTPTSFIASTVTVPSGTELIFLSGQLPSLADASAPSGSVEAYGGTETQAESTFARIKTLLETRGLTMGDVVSMTVYLVAAPGSDRMDFAAMMRAYNRYFGTPEQPHRPARSTVQVAGLAAPGYLIEIEVTAARMAASAP